VVLARYRSALRATVAASAAPYGYTLTIWTSGAVLSHAGGIPSTAEALLFLVGAVAAYALVGGLAFGGLAIVAASLVAELVSGVPAWPLGAFLATTLYLFGSASQLAVAHLVPGAGPRDRQAGGRRRSPGP
jgi:hypothetical protein